MSKQYPLTDEQEEMLATFICREVNRGYRYGFVHGFLAALSGSVVYYLFF